MESLESNNLDINVKTFKLKINDKECIIRENDLLKQGMSIKGLAIIKSVFSFIHNEKDNIMRSLANVSTNKALQTILNDMPNIQDVFKKVINMSFEYGKKEDRKIIGMFFAYHYDDAKKQLRLYLNREFLEMYLNTGKHIKSRAFDRELKKIG